MKLKTIIEKLDKSEKNTEDFSSEDLYQEFGLLVEPWDIESDSIREKIKCYWVAHHMCADTWVGIRAYFYEDELFAVSKQDGRKCDERFYFIEDKVHEVKEFLLSFLAEESKPLPYLDLDQNMGSGYYIEFASQLIGDKVIYKGVVYTVNRKYKDPDDKFGVTDKILLEELGEVVSIKDCFVPYCTKG